MARDRMGKYTQREWDRTVGYGPVPEEYKDIDPELREWEYDGDGTKIYKPEAGYGTKTLYEKKE